MEKKYSTITKTVHGFEHCVAYPDDNGNDTMCGLFDWEDEDYPNRSVYFTDTKQEAEELLNTLK